MAKRKRQPAAVKTRPTNGGAERALSAGDVLRRVHQQLEWLLSSKTKSARRTVNSDVKRRAYQEAAVLLKGVLKTLPPPVARAPAVDGRGIALTREEAGAMLRDVSGPREMLWRKLGRPVGPSNPAAHDEVRS